MKSYTERKTHRRGPLAGPLAVAFLALSLGACEGLLEVDLPGSLTEEALKDPTLAATLVTSAVGDFECGFVDYMRYPGQWFEMFQNTSQSRPDALSQFRSQLVGVYADPCSSGTGPIWTTIQVPRAAAKRAIDFMREFVWTPAIPAPDTTFLIAKARVYEGFSIQLLAEQFCAVTFDGGPLITREAAYDSAEVKFTDAMTRLLTYTAPGANSDTLRMLNASRVGRARARLYQWEYSGGAAADVIFDASAVTAGFQLTTTYDDNPARRRNRIREQINGRNMMPYKDDIDLAIRLADGMPTQGEVYDTLAAAPAGSVLDPRVRVTIQSSSTRPDVDGRGVYPMRRQTKMPSRNSPIPFASWREARLMIAEVSGSAGRLTEINALRQSSAGFTGVTTTGSGSGAGAYRAFPLPIIPQATWDALTSTPGGGQDSVMWEERKRELYLQGHQPGDKIRWAYPAWDRQDEYGAQVRNVSTIDDPLTPGSEIAEGCIPIPYLERTSNLNLIPLLQ